MNTSARGAPEGSDRGAQWKGASHEEARVPRNRAGGPSRHGCLRLAGEGKTWDIPTTTLGRTGVQVQVVAQGGARMDLHPDIPSAAKYVREVYELGVRYFDCARTYWNGQSEEAYGLGLRAFGRTCS